MNSVTALTGDEANRGTETNLELPLDTPTGRVCRECGCVDRNACVVTDAPARAWNQPGQPCWWVDDDLCSACSDRVDPRLTWKHPNPSQTGTDRPQQPALTWKEKAAFTWVAFAIVLAISHLIAQGT